MTEKFELGRLVATPGAIEATTLPQHFNLVARHARASRRASLRYARLEARGRMYLHTGAQPLGQEVFIPRDFKFYQFMPRACINHVDNLHFIPSGI